MENVHNAVKRLLDDESAGHGFEHVERVWKIAMRLASQENVDKEVVALAALLHDADDYKFFGEESAKNLTNARRIMKDCNIDTVVTEKVCDIILHMGYSKLLAGIRPKSAEGQIVSDADMLDAMGVNGIIRTLQYAFVRYQQCGLPLFDKNLWPETDFSSERYKNKVGNCINHFFEKILRLKYLMLTGAGRIEAERRHQRAVMFLEGYFDENNVPEWQKYLQKYLREQEKAH